MMPQETRGGTETDGSLPAQAAVAVPRLTAVAGPGAGRAFAMASALATVGRHPTNDLVLADPRVSGVHLELRRAGDRVRVTDAGSTNGTWIGAHRVTEIELAPGGEVMVGSTLLRLDRDDAAIPAKQSAGESFGELVGASTEMRELFANLERIAPKDLTARCTPDPRGRPLRSW
jgi:pSer/pThr/pTyr-binding forkhead associated (FHA) protein